MDKNDHLLSPDEIALYHDQGYVIPRFKLAPPVLDKMRAAYERLLAKNQHLSPDFILGPHLEQPGAQGVLGSAEWLDFSTQPEVLDIAAQLIGEDLVLWGTTIFGKPARNGKATPWHQDGDYYPIRPLRTITVWIAMDDATQENGCMRFIPGSHKSRKSYSHHWEENASFTINQVCDSKHFDENTAHDLLLEAGQMSFHDVYMIHGSHANTTNNRRAAFVIRLMPGHCHYDHALGKEIGKQNPAHEYGNRPLFLVRGIDRTGLNDFSVGHR